LLEKKWLVPRPCERLQKGFVRQSDRRYALRLLKAVTELLLGIIDSMYPLQCGIGYKMALSARFASALSNDCLREAWHTLRVQDVLSCRTNELISAVLKMLG